MTLNRIMAVILRHDTQSAKVSETRLAVSATKIRPKNCNFRHYMIYDRGPALILSWFFPENWPTPIFSLFKCATLRGHLSNSWALVLVCPVSSLPFPRCCHALWFKWRVPRSFRYVHGLWVDEINIAVLGLCVSRTMGLRRSISNNSYLVRYHVWPARWRRKSKHAIRRVFTLIITTPLTTTAAIAWSAYS